MNVPRIQGLVLAGGRSTRMQRDKAAIEFRAGETQNHKVSQQNSRDQFAENSRLSKSFKNLAAQLRHDQHDGHADQHRRIQAMFHNWHNPLIWTEMTT